MAVCKRMIQYHNDVTCTDSEQDFHRKINDHDLEILNFHQTIYCNKLKTWLDLIDIKTWLDLIDIKIVSSVSYDYTCIVLRVMIFDQHLPSHSRQLTTSIQWPCYCTVDVYVVINFLVIVCGLFFSGSESLHFVL